MVMICYFFYSLAEIRNISPQPYVTIVANNLSAKHKVVQLKAEIQKLHFKSQRLIPEKNAD
ncbi:hypothetical protein QW180_21655 [Vibrio sinaloensis]|nr:hypothetical protein [Vibrio sinaloensis]